MRSKSIITIAALLIFAAFVPFSFACPSDSDTDTSRRGEETLALEDYSGQSDMDSGRSEQSEVEILAVTFMDQGSDTDTGYSDKGIRIDPDKGVGEELGEGLDEGLEGAGRGLQDMGEGVEDWGKV